MSRSGQGGEGAGSEGVRRGADTPPPSPAPPQVVAAVSQQFADKVTTSFNKFNYSAVPWDDIAHKVNGGADLAAKRVYKKVEAVLPKINETEASAKIRAPVAALNKTKVGSRGGSGWVAAAAASLAAPPAASLTPSPSLQPHSRRSTPLWTAHSRGRSRCGEGGADGARRASGDASADPPPPPPSPAQTGLNKTLNSPLLKKLVNKTVVNPAWKAPTFQSWVQESPVQVTWATTKELAAQAGAQKAGINTASAVAGSQAGNAAFVSGGKGGADAAGVAPGTTIYLDEAAATLRDAAKNPGKVDQQKVAAAVGAATPALALAAKEVAPALTEELNALAASGDAPKLPQLPMLKGLPGGSKVAHEASLAAAALAPAAADVVAKANPSLASAVKPFMTQFSSTAKNVDDAAQAQTTAAAAKAFAAAASGDVSATKDAVADAAKASGLDSRIDATIADPNIVPKVESVLAKANSTISAKFEKWLAAVPEAKEGDSLFPKPFGRKAGPVAAAAPKANGEVMAKAAAVAAPKESQTTMEAAVEEAADADKASRDDASAGDAPADAKAEATEAIAETELAAAAQAAADAVAAGADAAAAGAAAMAAATRVEAVALAAASGAQV